MKAIFTLAAFLFITNAHSQSTTETEYNYMKKGYATSEAQGLDIKRGYYTDEPKTLASPTITIYCTTLRREKDKSVAGTIIKSVSNEAFGSGVKYWAVPSVNTVAQESYGWDLFATDINLNMSVGVRNLLMQWLAYQYAYLLSENNKLKP